MESRKERRRRAKGSPRYRILIFLIIFWALCLYLGWELGKIYWG